MTNTEARLGNETGSQETSDAFQGTKSLNLPQEFWDSRESLRHIQQAAYAKGSTPDVVLHCALARLAAIVPHTLRFDVGLGPGSLNLFCALIGASGTGKSTGANAAKGLLMLPSYLENTDFPDAVQLGSGEGLIEAYMGNKELDPDLGTGLAGKKKPDKVRCQIRNNGFFYVDEGQALVAQMSRTGATIGPILRSTWGGGPVGMANANKETTRQLADGSYSLGLVIGFQRSTAQPVLADAVAGTPQRFLWGTSTDPNFPDRWPDDPGPLQVSLTDEKWLTGKQGIIGVIEAVDDIRHEVQSHHAKVKRGQLEVPLLDSHRTYTLGKVAALLALLQGSMKIEIGDWELAEVMWATSCAVRDDLVAYGREEDRQRQEARNMAAVVREDRIADGREDRERRTIEGCAKSVARTVHAVAATAGYCSTSQARKGLHSRYRGEYWEHALEHALVQGWVVEQEVGRNPFDGSTVKGLVPGSPVPDN